MSLLLLFVGASSGTTPVAKSRALRNVQRAYGESEAQQAEWAKVERKRQAQVRRIELAELQSQIRQAEARKAEERKAEQRKAVVVRSGVAGSALADTLREIDATRIKIAALRQEIHQAKLADKLARAADDEAAVIMMLLLA